MMSCIILGVTAFFYSVPAYSSTTIYPENQEKYAGEEARIICDTATPPVWTHNDNIITKYYGKSMITFKHILPEHAGIYHCYGTDTEKYSFVVASHLIVGIDAVDKIQQVPLKWELFSTGKLICNNDTHTHWTFNNGFLPDAQKTNENVLNFDKVNYHNAGLYRCMQNFGYLKYRWSVDVKIYDQSKIAPQNQMVREGSTVTIQCQSQEKEPQWTFEKDQLSVHHQRKEQSENDDSKVNVPKNVFQLIDASDTIILSRVTRDLNQGDYVCQGKAEDGMFLAFSKLIVREHRPQKDNIATVKIGEQAKFYCNSLQDATTWLYNDGKLPATVITYDSNSIDAILSTLDVDEANIEHVGKYTCEAKLSSNHFYYSHFYLRIIVNCPPQENLRSNKIIVSQKASMESILQSCGNQYYPLKYEECSESDRLAGEC